MKIIQYKAKGYYGKKVDVPAKYAAKAKGLIKDVLKLKDEDGLSKLLDKYGYANRAGEQDILLGVKELLFYNINKNDSSEQFSKVRFRELKDNLYLKVCSYGADKINIKKTRKIKKKSQEEILKINKEHKRVQEKILKILRDD